MERPRLPNEAFDELNGDGAPSGAHREVSNANGARQNNTARGEKGYNRICL